MMRGKKRVPGGRHPYEYTLMLTILSVSQRIALAGRAVRASAPIVMAAQMVFRIGLRSTAVFPCLLMPACPVAGGSLPCSFPNSGFCYKKLQILLAEGTIGLRIRLAGLILNIDHEDESGKDQAHRLALARLPVRSGPQLVHAVTEESNSLGWERVGEVTPFIRCGGQPEATEESNFNGGSSAMPLPEWPPSTSPKQLDPGRTS